MGFSRQEYWSGLPCPTPEDLPDLWIEPIPPVTPAFQMESLLSQVKSSGPRKWFELMGIIFTY